MRIRYHHVREVVRLHEHGVVNVPADIGGVAARSAVALPGDTRGNPVLHAELMIHLVVETVEVIFAACRQHQILLWSGRRDHTRRIGLRPRFVRKQLHAHGVESAYRNQVSREGIPQPFTGGILTSGRRIVNRISFAAQREVSVVHRRGGHVGDRGFRNLLLVALESEIPERLVFAVINLRDVNRTARRGRHFLIIPRIARQADIAALELIEILAVHQRAVQVTVFHRTMQGVGAALIHGRKNAAAGMTELGGQTGGEHLEFLDHVERAGHDLLVVVDRAPHRFLAADTIEHHAERALALSIAVQTVDHVEARHIERHSLQPLLHHRNLHHRVSIHHLTRYGCLRFQQRGGGGDLDRIGDRAHFHLHIHARSFIDTQRDAVAHIGLESTGLDGDPVSSGNQIRDIVRTFRRRHGLRHKRGVGIQYLHLRTGHDGPGGVVNISNDCGRAVGLSKGTGSCEENEDRKFHTARDCRILYTTVKPGSTGSTGVLMNYTQEACHPPPAANRKAVPTRTGSTIFPPPDRSASRP